MKRILSLVLLVVSHLGLCFASSDEVSVLRELANRIIPQHAPFFSFQLIHSKADIFSLRSEGSKIVVCGNNAISMAVGLNYYLKNYCLCEVSWQHFNPVSMPSNLPVVKGVITREARVNCRFFLNYCTYGYTMPWWGWQEWERLIDWMALNGVNMPFANTGVEAVWQRVWRRKGLSDEQIRNFFTGPAFLAWHRMTNINGWMGPLPQAWIDGQASLQKRILQRERAFGMTPVLPSFNGSVPFSFKQKYPQADITQVSQWGGFADSYRTYFLSPSDPMFRELQKEFLEEQEKMFGTNHLYALDAFNEVSPPSWEPSVLASMGANISRSLTLADSQAVWVQMAWFLYNDKNRWTPAVTQAFLEAIPKGKLLMLDYYVDKMEVWKLTDKFYGHDYLVCSLGNFGGNTMLQGDIFELSEKIDDAIANGGRNMKGIGATPEGFGVNPDYYEFLFDKAWNTGVSDNRWIEMMADRHMGFQSKQARKVWITLVDSIMPSYIDEAGTVVCAQPAFTARYMRTTYPKTLLLAWKKLLSLNSDRAEYRFDVVNLGRQVIGDYFTFEKDGLERAYLSGRLDSLDYYATRMFGMLDDLDRLLATIPDFSLQRWNESARKFGSTPEEQDFYEHNARMLISAWGGGGSLADYANRTLAGMVSSYYKYRWEIFIRFLKDALVRHTAFDTDTYKRELVVLEYQWADPRITHISYPAIGADPRKVAYEVYNRWFASVLGPLEP